MLHGGLEGASSGLWCVAGVRSRFRVRDRELWLVCFPNSSWLLAFTLDKLYVWF